MLHINIVTVVWCIVVYIASGQSSYRTKRCGSTSKTHLYFTTSSSHNTFILLRFVLLLPFGCFIHISLEISLFIYYHIIWFIESIILWKQHLLADLLLFKIRTGIDEQNYFQSLPIQYNAKIAQTKIKYALFYCKTLNSNNTNNQIVFCSFMKIENQISEFIKTIPESMQKDFGRRNCVNSDSTAGMVEQINRLWTMNEHRTPNWDFRFNFLLFACLFVQKLHSRMIKCFLFNRLENRRPFSGFVHSKFI